jgi:hypothetical protein
VPKKLQKTFSPNFLSRLESNYLLAYPDFYFPKNLEPEIIFKALTSSEGRKIVFTQSSNYYFEDETEENPVELKNFKNLIGCGG